MDGQQDYTGMDGHQDYTGMDGQQDYTGMDGHQDYTGMDGQQDYTGMDGQQDIKLILFVVVDDIRLSTVKRTQCPHFDIRCSSLQSTRVNPKLPPATVHVALLQLLQLLPPTKRHNAIG
jgi:hypothetical protein